MGSTNNSRQLQFDSGGHGGIRDGKENMVGQAIFRGLDMLCPISTSSALAIAEQPELRAYKLGKQKCSYNQVELVMKDVGSGKLAELQVSEAIETCVGPEVDEQLRDSCLKFNVRFVSNNRMHLYIYVVYATPYSTTTTDKQSVMMYHWKPVTRSKCRKGCKGPVIRGLQRFGRMPRRNSTTMNGEDSWKEPRHLYIAIDEASTHVCLRQENSKFRLLIAAYDDKYQLLGTTVSSSIRVLANNDAPLGAASFKLHCHVKGGWGAGSSENVRSPRSYITDEKSKQVEHDRLMLTWNDKSEVDQEFLSVYKIGHTAPVGEAGTYPKVDKEHTLTDLCQRLFKFCVAKQEHGQATVTLRSLANTLGARRRRLLEILNVLESIQVIHHQGKERYTWIGSRQIAVALMKLKNSIPRVGEPGTDHTSRNFQSPIRRAKFKTSLSCQIEEMRAEASDPLRALSKRFIQMFLVHERYPVSWEQLLQSIVDGQGQDPETIRAKRRRLGEIARIFSALHLVRRATNQKLKSSVVYEWLGTQGVADHLNSINSGGFEGAEHIHSSNDSCGVTAVDGKSTRTHPGRVKSPTRHEKRSPGGTQGRNVYDHDLRSRQVTVADRSGEELLSQPEASIFQSISPIRRYRIQAASLPRQTISSTLQEIHHFKSSVPRTDVHHCSNTFLKRHTLDLIDVGILHSPCSESETGDDDFPFLDKTDEGSTATSETCEVGREHQAYQPRHMERWKAVLPKIMDGGSEMVELGHLVSEPDKPQDNECSASHCGSDALEEENNSFEPTSIIKARLARLEDHISGVSCSRARHQFPYKKRKLDVTSFACFAESNELESSRDKSKVSPSRDHDHELPQDHHQSCQLTFDPLFHLFCFYSPERIYELQCQNPAFLFTYVMESRALYNKWCAQNAGAPTLFRPLASVGKVTIAESGKDESEASLH